MFCTNCGVQFTGNFCPNCGAPAYVPSSPQPTGNASPYPAPPLGEYPGYMDSLTVVSASTISIHKNNRENGKAYETDLEIPFSDIAAVSLDDRGKGKITVICIRTKDTAHIPFAKSGQVLSDPFCVILQGSKEPAYRLYDFLHKVAETNAFSIPENPALPKNFAFQSLAAQAHSLQGAAARIQENQANGIACCPKCGSTSLSAGRAGFGLGKAAAGGLVAGPIGLAAGFLGSGKTTVTCLNCGHKWKL